MSDIGGSDVLESRQRSLCAAPATDSHPKAGPCAFHATRNSESCAGRHGCWLFLCSGERAMDGAKPGWPALTPLGRPAGASSACPLLVSWQGPLRRALLFVRRREARLRQTRSEPANAPPRAIECSYFAGAFVSRIIRCGRGGRATPVRHGPSTPTRTPRRPAAVKRFPSRSADQRTHGAASRHRWPPPANATAASRAYGRRAAS